MVLYASALELWNGIQLQRQFKAESLNDTRLIGPDSPRGSSQTYGSMGSS